MDQGEPGKMKHTMTLYIVDERIDHLMKVLDLFHRDKYLTKQYICDFTKKEPLTDEWFMGLINMSWEKPENGRIAAIEYMSNFYVHKDIKTLSDGMYEIWVNNSRSDNAD